MFLFWSFWSSVSFGGFGAGLKCMLISEKESLIDSDSTETNVANDEKGHTQGGSQNAKLNQSLKGQLLYIWIQ